MIAIENTRLLIDQREAINASPSDIKPVFDTVLEKGMRQNLWR